MSTLRPDVAEAVSKHAAMAYFQHAPSHYAIDLLNGLVAHLERSCRHAKISITDTRKLLDAFLVNVLTDMAAQAERDLHTEALTRRMVAEGKQRLPPVGSGPTYLPDYFRRAYEQDWPDGSIEA